MATISCTTTFNLTLTPKQFKFTDTTDWAGQSILTSSVNGSFKITAPSGTVIYNNTDYSNSGCDIRIANSLNSQQTIALPLDASNNVEAGDYIVDYTVYDSVALTYYTQSYTFTYEYEQPEISILQTVDCISPLFTSIDQTDYDVEGITPTITRTHTIDFPYGSAGQDDPVVGSAATVTTTTFYQGTQTTVIESELEYEFPDGLIVIDEISGEKEIVVDCTYVCSIYCCIRSIEQQMMDQKGVNETEYQRLRALFTQIMAFVGLAKLSIECGKSDDANEYLDEIRTLSNCTEDCSCSGDEPSLVTGIGGLVNDVVVDSGGAPITVTPVTVGNTTTYTVSISPSFVNTVNTSKTRVFANNAARTAAVPDFNGQLGVQLDTDTVFEALSTTAGDWQQVNYFKNGALSSSLMTKSATAAAGSNSQAIGNSASSGGAASNAIGWNASASGSSSISIGESNVSSGSSSISIGQSSTGSGSNAICIGQSSSATNSATISIGAGAEATAASAIAIGENPLSSGSGSIAIGGGGVASASAAISIGVNNTASAAETLVIGYSSSALAAAAIVVGNGTAYDPSSLAIGDGVVASGANSISIGNGSSTGAVDSISIGSAGAVTGARGIVIGINATSNSADSVVIGSNTSVLGGAGSIAIGDSATVDVTNATAVGKNTVAQATGGVALGVGATMESNRGVAIGSDAYSAAADATALGPNSIANITKTTNITGTIITRQDAGETDEQLYFSGALVTITGPEVDLKVVADTTSITIPTGALFYPDEVDLIITNANTVTGQPTIRAGGDASTASLLAAVATTALTTTGQRQRFATLLTATGQQTLTAGVTVGATGTTVKGRFVFRGLLLESQ